MHVFGHVLTMTKTEETTVETVSIKKMDVDQLAFGEARDLRQMDDARLIP
jgi:hypothetical protein